MPPKKSTAPKMIIIGLAKPRSAKVTKEKKKSIRVYTDTWNNVFTSHFAA